MGRVSREGHVWYVQECGSVQQRHLKVGGLKRGYHVWHDENSGLQHSNRCLVWMIYLNDDFEGGETEYLYYKKRIKAEKGKLLIWPAGMTHAHRGGLVL